MRLAVFFAIFILFAPSVVYGQQLGRHHTIEIEVECIETAREVINGLNGYNVDSWTSFEENNRWANFSRRVDEEFFRHVQEVLRDLGEVRHEHEYAWFLGSEIVNIETRMAVLSREMERLTAIMAASDSLAVLIAVNDRLAQVSRERDALVGRQRVLNSQIESTIVQINLIETPKELPRIAPATFGARVSRSFLNSWDETRRIAENTLVEIVYASIPLTIFMVIGGIFALAFFKIRKKRKIKEAQK
jgi:hypothetical protein